MAVYDDGTDAGKHDAGGGDSLVLRSIRWLHYAATPSFAGMALLTGISEAAMPEMLCPQAHASPWAGMALMYLLMAGFHSAPWLKLFAKRKPSARYQHTR